MADRTDNANRTGEGKAMSNYKVGDQLAFNFDYGRRWEIETITRITPSGRIICGRYTLDPDLKIRGRGHRSGFGDAFRAQPVTKDIRQKYARQQMLCVINKVKFDELSNETLKAIVAVIKSETQKQVAKQ